jgi:hypothetical protein
VGYFIFHQGQWWLVNENLPDLMDVATKTVVPIGTKIELTDGKQILLSRQDGGHLVVVQMVVCS